MSFDRIAPFYHFLERVCAGSLMQRCRVAHLPAVRGAKKVLIAGEGTGRFLAACAEGLPDAEFTVFDASEAMLRQAASRWENAGGNAAAVSFVTADLRDWEPEPESYDLIVTHYFLDCFSAADLPRVTEKLGCAATPNASWLLADFQEPPKGLARLRAQWVLAAAYAFFRFTARLETGRLTSPDVFLAQEGFHLTKRKIYDWGLMHSDLWSRVG